MDELREAAEAAVDRAFGERLVTTREVAEKLGVSERQVDVYRETGQLPYVVLGHRTVRFSPPDVAAFVQARRVAGEGR